MLPVVLILGASSRLGRMLRHHGLSAVAPRWQLRREEEAADAVFFDPLADRPPVMPCDAVLCLAGVISGTASELQRNSDLAEAAIHLGAASGAKRVFLASSAAVYGPNPSPLSEDHTPRPLGDYGRAKVEMEAAALACAVQLKLDVTILRIGNVAGADALLSQDGDADITLDRFADGQGPRRSYIGPRDLARVMNALLAAGAAGQDLPVIVNVALPGAVDMADLLVAAGRRFDWRAAPETAIPLVELDVSRLSRLLPLPDASAARIVTDWQAYVGAAA